MSGADIPDIDVEFSNKKISDYLEYEEGISGREIIEAAIDYELKLTDENCYCAVFPDDERSTEYMMVELPKSKLL